jgi:pimeloyl-ACP methyl ester carboxylesterase
MRRLKWLWIAWAAMALPLSAAYAVDRLLLAPACPACHAAQTETLPLFTPESDGLVRIRASGMVFRARVEGFAANPDGEGVILLHGFPETSIMWAPLMDKLAAAGFRVVAFDQRGYSPGARPLRVNAYTSGRLAADVVAVAHAVGFERFHVVGHDFGGAIAWIAADRFPHEVLTVTSLSTPHPAALAEALETPAAQWADSSYVLLYRLPWLPELVLGFNRASYLRHRNWRFLPAAQRDEYARVFGEPGALRGALNWYRAFQFDSHDPLGKITQPALFIWGNEDGAFGRVAANKTANHVDGPFRQHSLKAGHQLLQEAPDQVADAVLSHLTTWSQVSKAWTAALATAPQDDGSPCDQSRPHCLNIVVAPDGGALRIRNTCDERQRGAVRISCTGWAPEAFVEFRFDLGAKGEIAQQSNGFAAGACYYRHRLCAPEAGKN